MNYLSAAKKCFKIFSLKNVSETIKSYFSASSFCDIIAPSWFSDIIYHKTSNKEREKEREGEALLQKRKQTRSPIVGKEGHVEDVQRQRKKEVSRHEDKEGNDMTASVYARQPVRIPLTAADDTAQAHFA